MQAVIVKDIAGKCIELYVGMSKEQSLNIGCDLKAVERSISGIKRGSEKGNFRGAGSKIFNL